MSLGPFTIRVELAYQCLRTADLVLRDARIETFATAASPAIAIYDRHDASGIPAAWGRRLPALTARAKLRFAPAMARFWALAPRAVTGLKPFFPGGGLEIKIIGTWLWYDASHEQCGGISLRVTEVNAGRPEKIFMTVIGMASPFVLRRRIQLALGDTFADAADDAAWRAQRARLESHFGLDATLILEAFE